MKVNEDILNRVFVKCCVSFKIVVGQNDRNVITIEVLCNLRKLLRKIN